MNSSIISFNDVRVDPASREMSRNGEMVSVEPKVFDLLLFLISQRERVISRDEITGAIWPGMIISETALARAIMKARKAVGDDAIEQAVIRTVQGHGYRFVAELVKPDSGQEPAPALERRPGRRTWLIAVIIVLVGGLALFVSNENDSLPEPVPDGEVRIAVLPIDDRTSNPELSWIRLGLMSYANRMLSEASASETVPDQRMMSVQDEMPGGGQLEALQAVRGEVGASHLLHAQMRSDDGQLALDFRVFFQGGQTAVKTINGGDATRLARDMVREVVRSLPGGQASSEFRSVSDDPFVNEAYARGLALELQGDVARSREYFRTAVNQAPQLFWPRYELALMTRESGDLDKAQDELESLDLHAETEINPEAKAAVLNALGQVHWRKREYPVAVEIYQRALDAARLTDRPDIEKTIFTNLGILTRITGDLDGARDYLQQALVIAGRAQKPEGLGYIFHSMGQLESVAQNLPLAVSHYRRAYEEFDAEGNERGSAAARNNLARAEQRRGRFRTAETELLSVLETRQRLGDFFGEISSHDTLARLYVDMERYDEALEQAKISLQLSEEKEYEAGVQAALQVRIEVALSRGNEIQARSELDRLLGEYPELRAQSAASLQTARLAMLEGKKAEAVQGLEEVNQSGSDSARIAALFHLGKAETDSARAEAYWTEAIELSSAVHNSAKAGLIRLEMARRALRDDRPEKAAALLEQLAAEFPEWPLGELADTEAGFRPELP